MSGVSNLSKGFRAYALQALRPREDDAIGLEVHFEMAGRQVAHHDWSKGCLSHVREAALEFKLGPGSQNGALGI